MKTKVLEERARGNEVRLTWQRQIVNQANKVVTDGLIITWFEGRQRKPLVLNLPLAACSRAHRER